MKFNFFKSAEIPVVEDEKQRNERELLGFLKEYGNYSVGNIDALDNEKRNDLLEKIISRTTNLSDEEMIKVCDAAHLIDSERRDLLYTIAEQKMKSQKS
jgi:hypothetical protein